MYTQTYIHVDTHKQIDPQAGVYTLERCITVKISTTSTIVLLCE